MCVCVCVCACVYECVSTCVRKFVLAFSAIEPVIIERELWQFSLMCSALKLSGEKNLIFLREKCLSSDFQEQV